MGVPCSLLSSAAPSLRRPAHHSHLPAERGWVSSRHPRCRLAGESGTPRLSLGPSGRWAEGACWASVKGCTTAPKPLSPTSAVLSPSFPGLWALCLHAVAAVFHFTSFTILSPRLPHTVFSALQLR